MKPSHAIPAIMHLVKRQRPAFIWGPPGVGKSDAVQFVADNLGIELRDVRLSLMDPTDLKGFPIVTGTGAKKQMSWAQPDFLPTKDKGILFLDEMNSAPQAVQAAAYQLILNRKIGDYTLPAGWTVLAAGNRAGDRAVVHQMPSALANRLVHIDFDVDMEDWYDWATAKGVSDITRAFIRFRPASLHSFDSKKNERAFPTPRSWVFVDDIIRSGLPQDTELELIKGTVGEGAAIEYISFARMAKDLPTADEILINPDTAPIPKDPSGKYAICTALDSKTTAGNIDRMMKYITRIDKEYQVLYMRSAIMANRDLRNTKTYVSWIIENKELIQA